MKKEVKNKRFYLRGVKIDEKIQNYIEKKIEVLTKFSEEVMGVEVEIDRNKKNQFRVEVMLKTPGKLYRSEETAENIQTAIDIVEDELKGQLVRDKDRRLTLRKRGAQSIKKRKVVDKNARF